MCSSPDPQSKREGIGNRECRYRLSGIVGLVSGGPGARFAEEIPRIKLELGVTLGAELDADALRELTARLQALYDPPQDPREQVERTIRAGFDSWTGQRPVAYRRINESG
jgi:pyruvate, orthophosphate dikinase